MLNLDSQKLNMNDGGYYLLGRSVKQIRSQCVLNIGR